jgi:DNA-binding transcriptional LysR family regulator
MKQDYLNEISVFVEVATQGGFRAATQKLGMSAGSVSESIRRLEDKLSVRLFERTTRKIALTKEGEILYRRSLPAVVDIASAVRELNDNHAIISGKLRLSAPPGCGNLFLNDLLIEYAALYPKVDLEIIYDASKVDLVTAGIDACIRSYALLEQDSYAIPIGPELRMSVLASPLYIERMGQPKTPAELTKHDGICYAFSSADRLARWTFIGREGEYSVMPKPKVVVNDLDNLMLFAEAGLGLVYTYEIFAKEMLAKGSLIKMFESDISTLHRYTINHLSTRHMPNRLRALIELAKSKTY